MGLNRRNFLHAGAAAGVAGALPPLTAHAQSSAPAAGGGQAPGFQRFTVGDWTVTGIADGALTMNASVLPEFSEEEFAEAMQNHFLPRDHYPAYINAFLLQNGERTILIDAGGSTRMSPATGKLIDNLAHAGVTPADIDTILVTHMHIDHVGGLVDGDGAAVFPDAEVLVRARELSFWTDPSEASRIPEGQRAMAGLASSVASAYDGRLTPFEDDVTVVGGVDAVSLFGHTPGHTGYQISGGDKTLLIWADIIHIMPVQLPHPEVYIGFDVTPEEAVATRQRVFDMVASDRTMVAGMHLPFPGIGHVARDGDAYRYIPAPWQHVL